MISVFLMNTLSAWTLIYESSKINNLIKGKNLWKIGWNFEFPISLVIYYLESSVWHTRGNNQCHCGDRCEVTWERCLNMPGGTMNRWRWKKRRERNGRAWERWVKRKCEEEDVEAEEERKSLTIFAGNHMKGDVGGRSAVTRRQTFLTSVPWHLTLTPDLSLVWVRLWSMIKKPAVAVGEK